MNSSGLITRKAIARRSFLRGVGTAVSLPFLDAMVPAFATAAQSKAPVRMAFVYVPNGMDMRNWNPVYEGPLGELPRILKPLEAVKDDLLLMGNLTNNTGRALLDGAGDHGRCCGSYLTGIQVKKSLVDIKAGVSMDQLVANQVGGATRFPSLELGLEDARQSGDCDSGYSCAYTNNLAWRSETQPLPPTLDPRVLFERLFGNGVALSPEARARQATYRRSILDFVTEDTKKLEGGLGKTDRRKLDEYLSSIRSVELQLEKAEKDNTQIDPHMEKPYGVPADFAEHFRLMTDLMTIAMQADLTRVMTFLVTHEGTSRAYREIGIADGHHPLTHHMGNMEMLEKVRQINVLHAQTMAAFLRKMKETKEGDSNLLDNSMIVYGSGLSDGNGHTHDQLPTLLCGRGGGYINPGRHIIYQRETPVANLFATMLDRVGVRPEHVGDSTGELAGLTLS